MKNKILITAILLTGLLSASTYHYTFKLNDKNLFKNNLDNQIISNDPIMADSTPQERTNVQSTGQILASDGGVDWYGEVSAENFISGQQLAQILNFLEGVEQHSEEGWLHVGIDGKELFIAKKSYRHTLNWNMLNNSNLIFGNTTIVINNNTYKVRVFSCANKPNSNVGGLDHAEYQHSEWNKIMYRLTEGRINKASEEPFVHLAYYSEAELNINYLNSNQGSSTICQENSGLNALRRGNGGVFHGQSNAKSQTHQHFGWRPVLEKLID